MNAAERLSTGDDHRTTFRAVPAGLRVHVTGTNSFAAMVSCWRDILVQVRLRRPAALLLVDELRGPALLPGEWQALVEAFAGQGLENVRIAHVKPFGLQSLEYCEIYAREAGFDARVFDSESVADLWLRHGSH